MASFKSAYLIHGDDHGRIAERRASLRSVAQAESGEGGIELLEGDAATVDAAASALLAMSLTPGRRFVIVDGVERWKKSELEPILEVLSSMPEDTTAAFFGREEGRAKVAVELIEAVKGAGGVIGEEMAVKPWDLPKWVRARGSELGLDVDATAARTLVDIVGERQQRLSRELEKIALSLPPGASVDTSTVIELAAGSAERKVWGVADALVSRHARNSVRAWLELEAQGERAGALVGVGGRRLRDAVAVAQRLEAGESPSQIRASLRMPPKAADAFIRDVQRSDSDLLRDSLVQLGRLELTSRGGGKRLSERTAVAVAISEMTD
jgi:DNA polymerase-3 subunit delta